MVDLAELEDLEAAWSRPGKGRRLGTYQMRMPREPDKVLKIVAMKNEGMSYREIGERFGLSQQAPFLLYKRWHEWAEAQQRNGAANDPSGT